MEILTENQKKASDPSENVWVQANAGTGKTKVLVKRLLRILFNGENSGSILCLTYTTAGASEMKYRILNELAKWSFASDDELRDLLVDIIGTKKSVSDDDINKARRLFYDYIDARDTVKIQTIHSFCQDILSKFPLEAGINPGFSIIDDSDKYKLLINCFHKLFNDYNNSELQLAWQTILENYTETTFSKLQGSFLDSYTKFFNKNTDEFVNIFLDNLKKYLNLLSEDYNEIVLNFNKNTDFNKLKNVVSLMENDVKLSKTLKGQVQIIEKFINNNDYIDEYVSTFKHMPKMSKKLSSYEFLYDFFVKEVQRCFECFENFKNLKTYKNTKSYLILIKYFIKIYKESKNEKNVLDYDDLILYTKKLFSDPKTMGWILNQLDSKLKYILVDEAQDTNPEQWDIINSLILDFYNDNVKKTLFVVGDLKQSIFSFQGADPKVFIESENKIDNYLKENNYKLDKISLDKSFRTVGVILDFVDKVFNHESVKYCQTNTDIVKHDYNRNLDAGLVEILPCLILNKEINDVSFNIEVNLNDKIKLQYAELLADKINDLILNEKLESQNRNIRPDDIMVLVRKRTDLVNMLINSLKKRNISVNGSDKITLSDHIVVQDLLSIMKMCVNVFDDYIVACVLKSALFNLSENEVLKLCVSRKGRLIDEIKIQLPNLYDNIMQLIDISQHLSVYGFLMYLLDTLQLRSKFFQKIGDSIYDPLNEFINLSLSFDSNERGSLTEFIYWFETGKNEIKRDNGKSDGVRILTVHGSKGLESPIVFLIDTTFCEKIEQGLHFINDDTVVVSKKNEENSSIVNMLLDDILSENYQEENRLLYVAMTRAMDRLYIAGYCKNGKLNEKSWYSKLYNIASSLPEIKYKVDNAISSYFKSGEFSLYLDTKQIRKVECKKDGNVKKQYDLLNINPVNYNQIKENLILKCKIGDFLQKTLEKQASFNKGLLIHKMFEINKCDDNIKTIKNKYSWIFDNYGLNEQGFIDVKENGNFELYRIDRLVFINDEIHIIDYKTDENPSIYRENYKKKMYIYIDIVRKCYPDKKVFAHLLWLKTGELENIK